MGYGVDPDRPPSGYSGGGNVEIMVQSDDDAQDKKDGTVLFTDNSSWEEN